MTQPWAFLERQDRETFRATVAFLNKRLAEQATIDWALKLKPGQLIERLAVEYLLTSLGPSDLPDPWASAWRLIEESWSNYASDDRNGTAVYGIQKRLRAGDGSGAAVAAIVKLVAPRLKVEAIVDWGWTYVKRPRTPKTVEQVLSAKLTSGGLVDLNVLELAALNDVAFLISLANALEAAVKHGLDIARRLGWVESRSFLGLGMLNRVFYTQLTRRDGEDEEPDAYHDGIAPSVKLLHAIVARISAIRPEAAEPFVRRWKADGSTIFVRLWAAMARSRLLVAAEAITSFLKSTDDRLFWNVHVFPEIAELRAVRFSEFDLEAQNQISTRLLKGPPRSHWPKKDDKQKVANARQYWAVRELRRIEVAGGVLPARAKHWLDIRLPQFFDLVQMTIDSGFPEGARAMLVPPNPDSRYDEFEGAVRLQSLETALMTSRGGWDDDPAERANDWINQQSNSSKLLTDFEATNNGGNDFPKVWNRFGWAHNPRLQDGQSAPEANLSAEAGRVLVQLTQLSDATLMKAIEGISAWLDSWENQIVGLPSALPFWLRLWPLAVEATNRKPEGDDDDELKVTGNVKENERDQHGSESLNAPAGKLTGVFLAAWRNHKGQQEPFFDGGALRQMRDTLIATDSRSGLLVRYRLIEYLPYFLQADRDWAQEHLITPLLNDDGAALALWRAVARRTHFTEVLKIIGAAMAERANDRRLGRETRSRLVFSIVIEALHGFREDRLPAVPNPRTQQMLRALDDEVRASAANAIQQFVRELSAKKSDDGAAVEVPATAATLFRTAAAPFLREVWPQERSLVTPGVSGALADLPASSGEAFAEAVDAVARFLIPFECWSMLDYGLYGDEGEAKKLAIINDEQKAQALLKLLDLTVGASEGAVVPHDLTDALDQILSVVPAISESPSFRRLSTAARR